jgi:hypothetical protein
VTFVEVKAPGRKPRPLQQHFIFLLTHLGCVATWVDSKEAIDALFP